MQYVIVLNAPIRIGRVIFESIGPFENESDARTWIKEMNNGSIMPLPQYLIKEMQSPNEV
jgi:hypothetical protein